MQESGLSRPAFSVRIAGYFEPAALLVALFYDNFGVIKMSRVCQVTGKRPMSGNNVSHAHNKTRRRFLPNLHRVRVSENGGTRRRVVCASCIRDGKVVKA